MATPASGKAGWKTLWFGSESPKTAKVMGTVGLLVFTALAVAGAFVKFIPADGLHGRPAMWVFGFLGLMLTVAVMLNGISSGRARLPAGREGLKAALGILMMPLLVGGALWLAFIKTLPWAYARLLGKPVEIEATMHLSHRYSRRSCDTKLKGGPMTATFPDYVCVRRSYYDAHPDKDVRVRLVGRQTLMGTAITGVFHVEEVPAPMQAP
jgi:hypothetical protein